MDTHTHTEQSPPSISIRRGAKCGVGVATVAGLYRLPHPLGAPHNDIIIISADDLLFHPSRAQARESIFPHRSHSRAHNAVRLAEWLTPTPTLNNSSSVCQCVCVCESGLVSVCGIIPPEFAANPLNFATAHKK